MSLRALLAWLWTLVIFGLCWLPGFFLPKQERLPKSIFIPNFDKLVHFGIFAIFAFLWLRVIPGNRRGFKVFLAGLAVAVISELGQNTSLVKRDGNAADTLADMIGVLLGLLAFFMVKRLAARPTIQPEV